MQKKSNKSKRTFCSRNTDELVQLMNRPLCNINLMIVSASSNESISDIAALIDMWPNLNCEILVQCNGAAPIEEWNSRVDIILVDEPLEQITGAELLEILEERPYLGLIVSIKSGKKPAWSKFHFGGKNALFDSEAARKKFVHWMNYLIDEVQAIRLH